MRKLTLLALGLILITASCKDDECKGPTNPDLRAPKFA
jgi:hypothetical protein